MSSLKESIKDLMKTAINIILFLLYCLGLPALYNEICIYIFGECLFGTMIFLIGGMIIFLVPIVEYMTHPFERPPGEID